MGCRCVPDPGVTVEELLLVIGEQVGFENIVSASRMNKAVVVFFKSDSLVNQLTVSGIWVKETFVTITPLSAPATKITISNVPPFISNETVMKELQRFGKFAGQVRMIPLGCKNAALRHVLSFRRQVFMFLNSPERTLEASFRVIHGESSYMVYASTDSLRCFVCGDLGHKRFACPQKDEQRAATSRGDINNDQQTRDSEKQQDEELEEGQQQEVSETNVTLIVSSEEQPSCSSVSESVKVVIDKSETKSGVEEECEVSDEAQAEGVEENMAEEMDVLSQCTDDGTRDDDQWADFARGTEKDMYTVEQINSFLDETKGKAGVGVGDFFPDIDKFISSVMWARKVSSLEELSQQKRFRLKKYITVLRQGKKTGKARGKTK